MERPGRASARFVCIAHQVMDAVIWLALVGGLIV
jgi:hypothetical protein